MPPKIHCPSVVERMQSGKEMQIVIPMAGSSAFFPSDQYFFPKCLVEIHGRPMIEVVIENLKKLAPDVYFIFVVPREDVVRFSLDRTLRLLTEDRCKIVQLRQPTKGALCSALLAISYLNMDKPLMIANDDQIIDINMADITDHFKSLKANAGVVTFESVHPRWSFATLDQAGNVTEAAEKRVISRNAIAGLYYFDTADTSISF